MATERVKLSSRERLEVEQCIARTGSVEATMRLTGHTYRTVCGVLRDMAGGPFDAEDEW